MSSTPFLQDTIARLLVECSCHKILIVIICVINAIFLHVLDLYCKI